MLRSPSGSRQKAAKAGPSVRQRPDRPAQHAERTVSSEQQRDSGRADRQRRGEGRDGPGAAHEADFEDSQLQHSAQRGGSVDGLDVRVQGRRQIVAEIAEIVRDGDGSAAGDAAAAATATATAATVAAEQNAVLDADSIVGIQDYVHAEADALPRSVAAEEPAVHHDVFLRQPDVHRQPVHAVLPAGVRARRRLHEIGGRLLGGHLRRPRSVRQARPRLAVGPQAVRPTERVHRKVKKFINLSLGS